MEFIELMEYTYDNRDYHYIFYTYDKDRNLKMKEDSTAASRCSASRRNMTCKSAASPSKASATKSSPS